MFLGSIIKIIFTQIWTVDININKETGIESLTFTVCEIFAVPFYTAFTILMIDNMPIQFY